MTKIENPALVIKNGKKSFKDLDVLHSVSLELQKGQFMCFLGPSGCGKTTLLRAISGLESLDSGSLVMDGADVSNTPVQKRDTAIVFQSYALFPNLSVLKNVQYGMNKIPKSQRGALAKSLLQTVGLWDRKDFLPVQLSGGQQQRVALARALAVQPKILLLDEPLSALDKNIREHLRGQIKKIHTDMGLSSIMVTHDQHEALSMADIIVVMNQGYIEQIGTPQEIYNTPANRFVAEFIGNMSFLPAWITHTTDDVAVRGEDCIVTTDGGDYKGTIENIDFLGSVCDYHIALSSGDKVVAQVSKSRQDLEHIKLGDTITVSFPESIWHRFPKAVAESA